MFTIILGSVDLLGPAALPSGSYSVERLSWSAQGGPETAVLRAAGREADLEQLLGLLRSPIEVLDDSGDALWWGYLSRVEVERGALRLSADLARMANRVAVAYGYSAVEGTLSGECAITAWAEDAESVRLYGAKERLLRLPQASRLAAEAAREVALARFSRPIQAVTAPGKAGRGALLTCRGWFSTLGWKYYAQPAGVEEHPIGGTGAQPLGNSPAEARTAQSFRLCGEQGWQAGRLSVRARRFGAPGDALRLALRADAGGAPGALLAEGVLSADLLTETYRQVSVELAGGPLLLPETIYWLEASRTGGLDAINRYGLDVEEGLGYPRGALRLWNGASWLPRSPDADLVFRVEGVQETSAQIQRLCTAQECGQFLEGVEIEAPSGKAMPLYRDGRRTGLDELLDLFAVGGVRGRRLLARVDRSRRLSVCEAPAPGERDWVLLPDGRISTSEGALPAPPNPAGNWLRAADTQEPWRAFVEGATYYGEAGRVELKIAD